MHQDIIKFFETDLAKLRQEVEAFEDDAMFWSVREGITNSPGNLTLHLLGNLNHYIGAKIGRTGYVRNRPIEFSSGPQPRSELIERIDETRSMVSEVISGLTAEDMLRDYQGDDGDEIRPVGMELVRILTHLNYHLGQIN